MHDYTVLKFIPFTSLKYCNGHCVVSANSLKCDERVIIDDDTQDRLHETSCDDEEDNDGDGLIDCADGDCLIQRAIEYNEGNIRKQDSKSDENCLVLNDALVTWILAKKEVIRFHNLTPEQALCLSLIPELSDRLFGNEEDIPILVAWALRELAKRVAQGLTAAFIDVGIQILLEWAFGDHEGFMDAAANTDID